MLERTSHNPLYSEQQAEPCDELAMVRIWQPSAVKPVTRTASGKFAAVKQFCQADLGRVSWQRCPVYDADSATELREAKLKALARAKKARADGKREHAMTQRVIEAMAHLQVCSQAKPVLPSSKSRKHGTATCAGGSAERLPERAAHVWQGQAVRVSRAYPRAQARARAPAARGVRRGAELDADSAGARRCSRICAGQPVSEDAVAAAAVTSD